MPRYSVTFTGTLEVEAPTADEARKAARDHRNLGCFAGFNPREIGKDVDELGWPINQPERKPLRVI